ncbi:hypothetical protein [Streptomyces sp. BF23-30]|uniref:hypothetical protein n=1 Tax=Streptomyces sp. BF23-30 TaxID=3240281 RepID=UPI0034E450F6
MSGQVFHTIRTPAGNWSLWGNVAQAANPTGPITSVTMAGTGSDAHIVIAADNGTHQYHAIRKSNGSWDTFVDLKDALGTVTAKSLGATTVDGKLQLAATTADNKALHTIRLPNHAVLAASGRPWEAGPHRRKRHRRPPHRVDSRAQRTPCCCARSAWCGTSRPVAGG